MVSRFPVQNSFARVSMFSSFELTLPEGALLFPDSWVTVGVLMRVLLIFGVSDLTWSAGLCEMFFSELLEGGF